jgi:hypothetical protein
MTEKRLDYHSQKALETANLKGQKVVFIFNNGESFVGYIVTISYSYNKREGGCTDATGFNCDPNDWAGSDVWQTRNPENCFDLDEIQSIHIVERSVTPMGGKQ